MVIGFVDGTEIEVGVMIMSNHFGYILVSTSRTNELGSLRKHNWIPVVSDLSKFEMDFLSNQCQLDLWRNLSSLECFLLSVPLLEYWVEVNPLFL